MFEKNDQQLIEDYLAGHEAAFALLVERYLKPVVNFVHARVSDRQVSEELAQGVFLKVWKNLKKFKSEKNFRTWLLTIAKHTAIDYLRQQKNNLWALEPIDDETSFSEELPSLEPLPDELFDRQELKTEVAQLISGLRPAERSLIDLYYHQQMTFEEIAEILGESANTVKSRHRRLLLKLRAKI